MELVFQGVEVVEGSLVDCWCGDVSGTRRKCSKSKEVKGVVSSENGLDKGANVNTINWEVEAGKINDVVNCEFLLKEVWRNGGVGNHSWEEKFYPNDRACDL